MELDLSDLLKSAEDSGLLKKKKRSNLSPAKKRDISTYIPIKERFRSVSLVMLEHIIVCDCCKMEYITPNQPLLKRVNDKGDVHYAPSFTREEFLSLPKEREYKKHTTLTCSHCFEENDWMPVQLPPNNDKEFLITQLLEEIEENENDE